MASSSSAATVAAGGRRGDGIIDGWDGSFTASSAERAPRGGGGRRTAALLAKFTRTHERERCRSARRPRHDAAAPRPRGGGRADELDEDLEWTLRTSSAFAGVENLV